MKKMFNFVLRITNRRTFEIVERPFKCEDLRQACVAAHAFAEDYGWENAPIVVDLRGITAA